MGNKTLVTKLTGVTCDAMLVSHIHGDHFSLEQIKALSPKVLYINAECQETLGEETLPFEVSTVRSGDELHIGDIDVTVFTVDHGPNVSKPLQENFGFLVYADGQTIYFGGDIFYPSGVDVSSLEVDIALIPVGGFYTFGPEEAVAFAKQFKKIGQVIPMHYENKPETRGKFVELAQSVGLNVG